MCRTTAGRSITAITFIVPPQRGQRGGSTSYSLPDEAGPRAADFQGHPIIRVGDWVRRLGFPEEPVPLAVTPRPIGVPAIEDGRLLVRIRDVGTHLGQEVQGIEHAEVRLVTRVDNV